jgi:DNA-binding response OmpR family regulator
MGRPYNARGQFQFPGLWVFAMAKILLAEDDINFGRSLASWLEAENFDVEWVLRGSHVLERLDTYSYDLIIMDWQLPETDGIEICQSFRRRGGRTPIIMLTGKDHVQDKVKGLESGADDYLSKPFEMAELLARLHSLLRRPPDYVGSTITVGDFEMNTRSRTIAKKGAVIKLQPKEYAIVEFLMRNQGKVFSTDELLKRIWTDSAGVSSESLYTYMKTLRRKLAAGDEFCPIKTVHSQGYSFDL